VLHECLTCEGLGREVFARQACDLHDAEALAEVKRHALVAHPINILRVLVAGLRGEKI
jgi:hypothetical protein